jgi:hypothetical protein
MDVLTIGQHDDVTPQSVEKDLAQRDAVAALPQTEGPQGTCPSASMDTSETTLWRTSSSDCIIPLYWRLIHVQDRSLG